MGVALMREAGCGLFTHPTLRQEDVGGKGEGEAAAPYLLSQYSERFYFSLNHHVCRKGSKCFL